MKWVNVSGCALLFLTACTTTHSPDVTSANSRSVPVRQDRNTIQQLVKTDIDRMADIEYAENMDSMRVLMAKLYKRNPAEARKSGLGTPEQIIGQVFDRAALHQWRFPVLANTQGAAAIQLALNPQYAGDRVLALTVGIQSMLFKAHGNKSTFLMTDSIDPQNLYNAARNIEIVLWKLSTAKDNHGNLLLLTNTIQGEEQNLSFEREFSKMIARTDLLAMTLAEKSQRLISRLTQSITTAPFLPF